MFVSSLKPVFECSLDGGHAVRGPWSCGHVVCRRGRRLGHIRSPQHHWALSPSRNAIASCSTRTASMTGTTGRASNTKAGNIEQNLCTANGSSQSNIIYPPSHPPGSRTTRFYNRRALPLRENLQNPHLGT